LGLKGELQVLIATPVKNAKHILPRYFEALRRLTFPHKNISIVLLESDSSDGTPEYIMSQLDSLNSVFKSFRFIKKDFNFEAPLNRHDRKIQLKRRQILASSRNTILDSVGLHDFAYVLWLDVDSIGFEHHLIEDLISVRKPIVAPNVMKNSPRYTYDLNSWFELKPEIWNKTDSPLFEGYPEDKKEGKRLYLENYQRSAPNFRFATVPLHGVGTCVLLVEAKVHLDGLHFPIETYKRRLESEGFGLLAMDKGYQAVGLPWYVVFHED
jgi:mannan polymerase complexes MNN9 subunit